MILNPPPKIRAAVYVFTALATPVMTYLLVKGYIGEAEMALWGAEMTAVFAMAGLNVTEKK